MIAAKVTPYMSNTSRSSQPATGHSAGHARHRRILVGRDLDADAVVMGHRQQVIIHLEPLGPLGIVDPGDLHQLLVAELVAGDAVHLASSSRVIVKVSSPTASLVATCAAPIAALNVSAKPLRGLITG